MSDDTKKTKTASSGLQLLRIGNRLKGPVCINVFDRYYLIAYRLVSPPSAMTYWSVYASNSNSVNYQSLRK